MPADVSAPLPQLDLNEGTVITVTLSDPNALVTQLTLHGWQELPPGTLQPPPILLAVEPEEGG